MVGKEGEVIKVATHAEENGVCRRGQGRQRVQSPWEERQTQSRGKGRPSVVVQTTRAPIVLGGSASGETSGLHGWSRPGEELEGRPRWAAVPSARWGKDGYAVSGGADLQTSVEMSSNTVCSGITWKKII